MSKPAIKSYFEAACYLRKSDNLPAGYGDTRIVRLDADTVAVRLHETDIVTYHADGRIALKTGGWKTVTTKARMNVFSPVTVHQVKGEWFANDVGFTEGMDVAALALS